MNWDAQNLIVLAVVGLAAGYLLRSLRQIATRRKAAACGACASCPAAKSDPAVVSLSMGAAVEPGKR